ncbi:MAG: hypothetical protein K5774_08595 [Clostridia bacterium]|nr:hypothetical protein [Clostridia bacterium]
MSERLTKLRLAAARIREYRLPFVKTALFAYRASGRREVSLKEIATTSYLSHPGTFMPMNEYICRACDINDLSQKAVLMEKPMLFKRLGGFMGRECLVTAEASDRDIEDFMRRCGRAVGKMNLSAARGFRVFQAAEGMDSPVREIRESGCELLEPFIEQHPAYSAIYPNSVNTLRIHTARNSSGIRHFLTIKLRAGAGGSVIDYPKGKTHYRLMLTDDGEMIAAFRYDTRGFYRTCELHEDTGFRFEKGKKLPFVREAVDMCLYCASLIPETRYIGWDVAVTPSGPVIVEGNEVSGAWEGYQEMKDILTGSGSRAEAEEMLGFAVEGAVYDEDKVFFSKPFAPCAAELPAGRQLYLSMLQSALHRHGMEFFDREFSKLKEPKKVPCVIAPIEDGRISIEINGNTDYVDIGPVFESDLFTTDSVACSDAGKIYAKLSEMYAASARRN